MKTVNLSDAVAGVLRLSKVVDAVVYLPDWQLEPKLYKDVNKALEAMGGKWNRKAKGHTFSDPHETVAAKFDEMLERGVYAPPSKNGYFPTPPALVGRLIELANIKPCHRCLEPSAGQGAIADRLREIAGTEYVDVVEMLPANCEVLTGKGYRFVEPGDFLKNPPVRIYDRVVLNPPFERQQDIDHVTHAFKFLKNGGRLVSVMAAGVTFRQDKKAQAFRDLIASVDGIVETNPAGSFHESGTDVSTVTVVLDKPEVAS